MKRAHSQEPSTDLSHSSKPPMTINQVVPSDSGSKVKSAAMLGLALSVSASGVLLADGEASATDLSSVEAASASLPLVPGPASLADTAKAVAAPDAAVYHTVEEGESLWKIAERHRVSLRDIETANSISEQEFLQVGQVIKVPSEETAAAPASHSVVTLARVDAPETAVTLESPAEDDEATIATVPTVTLTRTATPTEVEAEVTTATAAEFESAPVISTVSEADTLQNAGLTTQADGFQQELERQEVLANEVLASTELPQVEVTGEPNVPVITSLSPNQPQQAYQVQTGDTLESIAGGLGLSAEDLAGANGLADPNFIMAGETLALPQQVGGIAPTEAEEVESPVVAAAAAAPDTAAGSDQRLAYLQSTAERQVSSNTLLSRLRGEPEQVAVSAEPEVQAETEVVQADDPYAASLLGQVRAAQTQTVAVSPASEADSASLDGTATVALADQEAVNAEFSQRESEAARELAAAPDETLLAAAPLGPEAYVPAPPSNVGQVVSPDMPILPDADSYLPDAPDYFDGYIWPARGTLTSGYGPRWGRMHRGLDIAAPVGTPIVAAAPGVVERSGWNSGGYGNLVEIRHPDGSMTRYAHNSRLLVRPGQRVSQGEQIAEMGSTGYSTGPHLHFEVHASGGGTVNPMAYLPSR